jgi:hypothetical protein
MNFIGSVLIQEAGEEGAFYTFMYLLLNLDIRALFQAVSDSKINIFFLGVPRASPQELSNGLAYQVSPAENVLSLQKNTNVT